MATGKTKLSIRVALPTGKWAYVAAAFSGKGKIRPEYALIDDKAEHHPEAVYALRFSDGAKRVWESVCLSVGWSEWCAGADPSSANTAAL